MSISHNFIFLFFSKNLSSIFFPAQSLLFLAKSTLYTNSKLSPNCFPSSLPWSIDSTTASTSSSLLHPNDRQVGQELENPGATGQHRWHFVVFVQEPVMVLYVLPFQLIPKPCLIYMHIMSFISCYYQVSNGFNYWFNCYKHIFIHVYLDIFYYL